MSSCCPAARTKARPLTGRASARSSRSRWWCSGSSRAAASSSCCLHATVPSASARRSRSPTAPNVFARCSTRVRWRRCCWMRASVSSAPTVPPARRSGMRSTSWSGAIRRRSCTRKTSPVITGCASSWRPGPARARPPSDGSCIETGASCGASCMCGRSPEVMACGTTCWCWRTSPIGRSSRSSCRSRCATSRRCSKRCRSASRRRCRARSCWPTASSPTCSVTATARSSACRCGT